ncbi:SCP domain-containing protein, partial [Trichostrongylus colubriformis]
MTPPGGSINIYTTTLPIELPSDTMITIALSAWMSEINLRTGPDVSSAQQNFVNMMYYKSTQVGCSYQKCDANGGLYFYTIACAFDQ